MRLGTPDMPETYVEVFGELGDVSRGSRRECEKAFRAGMEVRPARWVKMAKGGGVGVGGGEPGVADVGPDKSDASQRALRSILFVSRFWE